MKFSRFTKLIPHSISGQWFAFNTLFRTGIVLSEDLKRQIEDSESSHNQALRLNPDVFALERLGIIVDESLDEEALYNYWMNKNKYDTHRMMLTVLTTYDCNLSCVYCFEGGYDRRSTTNMPPDVCEHAIQWIGQFLAHRRPVVLDVCFFGGEPLLNLEAIHRFTTELRQIVKKLNLKIFFRMISNGTLLTREVARDLYSWGVRKVAITMDGPQEIHDRRRPYSDGSGSFEMIFQNIISAAKVLNVRINIQVDTHNSDYIVPFLDMLAEHGLKEQVSILFGTVMDTTWHQKHCQDFVHKPAVMGKYYVEAVKAGLNRGFRVEGLASTGLCPFNIDNDIIIDTKGDLYKCLSGVGHQPFRVGTVSDNLQTLFPIFSQFIEQSLFNNQICRECVYLPLCGSGCRYQSYVRTGDYRTRNCHKPFFDKEMELMRFLYDKGLSTRDRIVKGAHDVKNNSF